MTARTERIGVRMISFFIGLKYAFQEGFVTSVPFANLLREKLQAIPPVVSQAEEEEQTAESPTDESSRSSNAAFGVNPRLASLYS